MHRILADVQEVRERQDRVRPPIYQRPKPPTKSRRSRMQKSACSPRHRIEGNLKPPRTRAGSEWPIRLWDSQWKVGEAGKIQHIPGAISTGEENGAVINPDRSKLINVVIYFATRTRYCGKTKLFKLLYFLDFTHYTETGRSVTGLQYFAWDMGPVPKDLASELTDPPRDLAGAVTLSSLPVKNGVMLQITPTQPFSQKLFSPRELGLLKTLADQYRSSRAEEMIEATHLENLPWHQVYEVRGDKYSQIPYDLALRKQEADEMRVHQAERDEFWDDLE